MLRKLFSNNGTSFSTLHLKMRAQYMPLILQGTNPERNPALYPEPWKADGIEEDKAGYFLAELPVLPGCLSQGKTQEEALRNVK